ncbi:MAG: SDR family NAD(P)-dependent oxidoreductase, partial [Bacillota bacterium]|nr:SDR family NAD(P)-dependent oxidoreductase [Bacillota bacterium]
MTHQQKTAQAVRVVVITGASSGIGKALAGQMAMRGDHVYALARSLPDQFGQTAVPGNLRTMKLDVTDAEAARAVIARVVAEEQRIDVLIQAAGFGLAGAVEAMTSQEAAAQMATNYLGVCNMLPPVLARMRQQGSGLIVQLGSVAGFLPIPFQACYSASKAAVAALTQALANEVKPYGIRCLLVQPGDTQTGFTDARIISKDNDLLPYAARCRRSVERMAADEQNGMPAEKM